DIDTCASLVALGFLRVKPLKNSRPVPRNCRAKEVWLAVGSITAKLGSARLPMAVDIVSGPGGPDVGLPLNSVPWDVAVIVPVTKPVVVEPNIVAISWRIDPYGGNTIEAGFAVPGKSVPSACVALTEIVCCAFVRLSI